MLTEKEIITKSKKVQSLRKHGYVYFLIKNNVIVYVGQTKSIDERLRTHKRDKDFDRVTSIKVAESELNYTEAYYIKKFKPVYNKLYPPYYFEPIGVELPDDEAMRKAYDKGLEDYERIMSRLTQRAADNG